MSPNKPPKVRQKTDTVMNPFGKPLFLPSFHIKSRLIENIHTTVRGPIIFSYFKDFKKDQIVPSVETSLLSA